MLAVVAFIIRLVWSRLLPLDGGNDEIFHLHTAWLIAGGSPGSAAQAGGYFHPVYGFLEYLYADHPRGAYLVGAALFRLSGGGPDAYLWTRLGPVLLGALAVPLAYGGLRLHWSAPSPLPLAAAGLMAFGPQFVFVTSYFCADGYGLFAAGVVYLAAAMVLKPGWERWAALPGVVGLALLTLAPRTYLPAALALMAAALLRWRAAHRAGRDAVVGVTVVLLVVAAFHGAAGAQPRLLPGGIRPAPAAPAGAPELAAPAGSVLPGFQRRPGPRPIPAKHAYLYRFGLGYLTRSTFISSWGVFGYMSLLMPASYYLVWGLFCAAALLGLGIGLARSRLAREGRHPRLPLLVAYGIPTLAVLLGHIYYNLYDPVAAYQPQGRYLFGALVPLLTFLALGLDHLLRVVGRRQWLAPLCLAWALSANVWCLAVISAAPWPRLVWVP